MNREKQKGDVTINRLHLHYREDDRLYKKCAKSPFNGIAEEFNINGKLVTRTRINQGKQDGFIEGFCSDGKPLFRGIMKNGEFDHSCPLEIFSRDGSFSRSYIKNGQLKQKSFNNNDEPISVIDHYTKWWASLQEKNSINFDPIKIIKSFILLSH